MNRSGSKRCTWTGGSVGSVPSIHRWGNAVCAAGARASIGAPAATSAVRSDLLVVDVIGSRRAHATAAVTSSVNTVNCVSVAPPNDVVSATSTASRPRAITTRPMRGRLCRASITYHAPST